jgi:hypothetical protein
MNTPTATSAKALPNRNIEVAFDNGAVKIYHMAPLIEADNEYERLNNETIFQSVTVVDGDPTWDDGNDSDITISCRTVWEDGATLVPPTSPDAWDEMADALKLERAINKSLAEHLVNEAANLPCVLPTGFDAPTCPKVNECSLRRRMVSGKAPYSEWKKTNGTLKTPEATILGAAGCWIEHAKRQVGAGARPR